MIRFGVCATFDKLNDIMDAGFDYIEPKLSYVAAMSDDEFEEAEKRIAASPLQAEAFNGFLPSALKIVGEHVDMDAIAAYADKALGRAARLGGKVAALGSGKSRCIPNGFPRDTAIRQLREVFCLCAAIGDKYGIAVALEPLNHRETNLINTVAEALEICRLADHPNGKCLADFFHVSQSGESLNAIRNSGNRIIHIHLANPNRDMPVSETDINLCHQWAQALKDCGYEGRLSLEGHYAPDYKADITRTRKILDLFNA